MKALIAAGGRGTRLRPITNTLNKHLIPIANKPMIGYVIEKLRNAGVTEIAISTNPGDREISNHLGDGSRFGVSLSYIEQQGGPLGVAHVVKCAEYFMQDSPFVFFLGDNIIAGEIKPLVEKFQTTGVNCQLALAKVKDPRRFGVAEFRDGKLVGFQEKPSEPKSDFAVSGIYIYDKHIFEAVNSLKPSWRGEFEITEAHQYLLDHGYKVGYEEVTGWWKDTGKPEDLLEGNSLLLSEIIPFDSGEVDPTSRIFGPVQIGKGTVVKNNSVIRGPVAIGENCVIDHAYIGPYTSISDKVHIQDTEIEHSIVFSEATIINQNRIIDSLLGTNCHLSSEKNRLPSGKKFIIGENTTIEN